MMSLSNNNLMHMAVSNENNVPNSQEISDVQTHTQGQFPTYSVVTSTQTRVSQVLTNTEKPDLASNVDGSVKSPVNKTSIISVVKGTGTANQQIFVQKSPNDSSNEGQSRNMLNDVSLIHPRTPGEDTPNLHFVRKNNVPSRELQNESPNRSVPSDSHVVHHTGNSMAGSFSPNMSLNNQAQAPPPYVDATSYTHRDITHSSFQRQSPFELHEPFRPAMHQQNEKKPQHEVHESSRAFHQHSNKKNHQVHDLARSPHQQSDKKSQQRHESSRPSHQQQGDKKVHVIHESPRSIEQQGEHQHQQLHPTNRVFHQQGDKKSQLYESTRPLYQHNEQKTQQKHEVMRPMQQRETNRVIQQHGEHKGQQLREPIYHHSEQKSQKIHYQLSDQKNQQMHLSSRPMYIHADPQKSPQMYETGRQLLQHGEQKGQQMHESPRSYQHNEQKKQHQHDASRMMHQHNDQKNQQAHESSHQPGHHATEQQQKKQHESSRSNDQKNQQKNVHKFHHGNARVKYVEFKPIQEGMKYRQMMHHSQHSYNPNLKQTLYYSNHVPNNPGSHHLTVQTQSHSPLSPLHSPPALRPPPTIPSGTAWHSPPSLVPSPEVRPRFDFISSPQPVTTAGSPHPVQVANMVHHKAFVGGKGNKQMSIPASHNILLPRLPGNYLGSPGHQTSHANIAHVNVVPRSKATFNQTPSSNSPGSQPVYDNSQLNHSQSGIPVSSVATTVTVTMTYIPIPTSTKDKFVYVPVNSGQPVVLYQNQQPSGKPVILPQQMMQPGRNVSNSKDNLKDPSSYTTVRLQGLVNCGKSPHFSTGVVSSQNSPMKSFKYHFANTPMSHGSNHSSKKSPGFVKLDQKAPFNMNLIDLEKEKYNLTPISTKDMLMVEGKQREESKHITDNKSQGDVMTLINSQLRLVPPHVGISSQATGIGAKRNNMGVPISNNSEITIQSPVSTYKKSSSEELTMTIPNDNTLSMPISDKDKKKRGRPPTDKIPRKGRRKEKGKGKLSPMHGNLLTVFSGGQSNTNEALIEAYRKQQQILLQKHYFEEPLLSLPDLPPTPESWSCEDVHRYLLSTDCSIYADAIKTEEIDGNSFLLLTREALVDFLGIKLGPALKIAGHAASLRGRQRIYCLTMQQQEQKLSVPPKEKKVRLTSKINQKQSEPAKSNSLANEDTITLLTSSSSANEDSVVASTIENVVPTTELIIPNISILSAPSEEKKIKPILEPLLVTERSPVILKVPNPLSIILGDSNSTKPLETIELNGETPEELHVEEKGSANFPVTDEIVNNDIKSSTENLHLSMQNITTNKFEFSSKPLSSSTQQIHTLTEIEPDGIITHENS